MSIAASINELIPLGKAAAAPTARRDAAKDSGADFARLLERNDDRAAKRDFAPRTEPRRADDRRPEPRAQEPRPPERQAPERQAPERPGSSGARPADDQSDARAADDRRWPSDERSASSRGDDPPGLEKQGKAETDGQPGSSGDAADGGETSTASTPKDAGNTMTDGGVQPEAPTVAAVPLSPAIATATMNPAPVDKSDAAGGADAGGVGEAMATAGEAAPSEIKTALAANAAIASTTVQTIVAAPLAAAPSAAAADPVTAAVTAETSGGLAGSAKPQNGAPSDGDGKTARADAEKPAVASEARQAAHGASAGAFKDLVAAEQPKSSGPTQLVQTVAAATAGDAAAAPRPADPATAMARADAPMPLHAVAVEIGMRSMRGAREFQIRLDPEDLGRIDVKLEISDAGDVQAKLVVDKVETLQLLQRDARTLERAFDQAGLKTNPDALQFSLRDPGQQDRGGGRQARSGGDPGGLTDKSTDSVEELTMRPAIYRSSAAGGLDIRI